MLRIMLSLSALVICSVGPCADYPSHFETRKKFLNDLDPKLVNAGQILFNDLRLSKNRTISCSTCHNPELAYSNGLKKATGENGIMGEYNVPVIFDRGDTKEQFWDGRAPTLKDQVLVPIFNHNEMNLSSNELEQRVNEDSQYRKLFEKTKVTTDDVKIALEAFVSAIVSTESRFDLFEKGDKSTLNKMEQQGKKLFFEIYKCVRCHTPPEFTDNKIHPRCGVPLADDNQKYGHAFKVPTLRNLRLSRPYFHNGNLETLSEVLDFYDSSEMKISKADKKAIIHFLNTLNSGTIIYRPAAIK